MRAFRVLVRAPAFTMPVVVGLAFAIGATTTVFSMFSAMLLRSMGFRNAQSIVAFWRSEEEHGQKRVEISYGDLLEWRQARGTFADVALASSVNLDFPLVIGGAPELVDGSTVTGNFFRLLGATPLAGRFFTDEDDRPGAPTRVVISYQLWRNRFGADYSLVGRQVRLSGSPATVVGITRPEFDFPGGVALWVPLRVAWPDVEKNPDLRVFRSVARLAPGVSVAQARARLDVIARHGESDLARRGSGHRVLVTPVLDEIYGAARPAIWILLGAVGLVLLIACANAANLLLNRAAERSHELAIRAALGAGRSRLVRLLVGESAVLGAAAGACGLLLAATGVELLVHLAPADVPRIGQATIDFPILLFGVALTLLTVLFFGVGPAFLASRRDATDALQRTGRRSAGSVGHARVRQVLIAGEGALSALLLVIAGMLVHSFANLTAIDPGFHADHVLTFRITLQKPDQQSRRAFYGEVLDRVRALAGVESAAAVLLRPLSGTVGWDAAFTVEGQTSERQKTNPNSNYEAISSGYFHTMGIRLAAGRDFDPGDTAGAPGVVILDEATARKQWPHGDALGKRIRLGADPKAPWLTVVGVVAPVRSREWEIAWPDIYVPLTQRAQHRSDFVVRTAGDPWKLIPAVRHEVFTIDRNQPISSVTTMAALVDAAIARQRFNAIAMAALAGCALLLAAIGIYSVLSYAITRRRTEIGIRMAVGATPGHIVWLTLLDGTLPLLAGAAVGLVTAAWIQNLTAALLFGVGGLDPAAYAVAAAALLLVAVAACVAPALRAASTDPARALQSE